MTTLVAGIDNSVVARPVIETAIVLADLLKARVQALHVEENGIATARVAAEAAQVPLLIERGSPAAVISAVVVYRWLTRQCEEFPTDVETGEPTSRPASRRQGPKPPSEDTEERDPGGARAATATRRADRRARSIAGICSDGRRQVLCRR